MRRTERTERMIGTKGQEKLAKSAVAIFGLGGVGSFCCEAIARAGVGRLLLVDGDVVEESNINRQLYALTDTIGLPKAELAKQRCLKINPNAFIEARQVFFDADTQRDFSFEGFDYVVDAIDSVSSKILLIEKAWAANVPIVCAMGAGNKFDPTAFRVSYIEDTKVCPLARVMRRELKARGIARVQCVYSEEPPIQVGDGERAPGSISFVPSAAGLVLAGAVIRGLLNEN
ncbi:MAG: tRNA threonylcarbamoyladenosine dehydratase [Christensenellales bacterium]|jgi:tRNA A37 threonylcarbamoyladenosine dehydratase